MSSYEARVPVQVCLDNMILKYSIRSRDIRKQAALYADPEELEKQINLIVSDLKDLKQKLDKANKGGK